MSTAARRVGAGRIARPATASAAGLTTASAGTSRDELYAARAAVREAAREAELEALEEEHRKRVADVKRLHAAQVRHQKEFLRSIGVPDLSPEEVAERARRDATLAYREEAA